MTDELERLIAAATKEDLTDGGRYFAGSCDDLTKCGHGDTGEYQNAADGELIEYLWNNRHALTALAAERDAMREELAHLKAEIREKTPYTDEEIEVFQSCFDRGLIGVDELIKYSRDERLERARTALSNSRKGTTHA